MNPQLFRRQKRDAPTSEVEASAARDVAAVEDVAAGVDVAGVEDVFVGVVVVGEHYRRTLQEIPFCLVCKF